MRESGSNGAGRYCGTQSTHPGVVDRGLVAAVEGQLRVAFACVLDEGVAPRFAGHWARKGGRDCGLPHRSQRRTLVPHEADFGDASKAGKELPQRVLLRPRAGARGAVTATSPHRAWPAVTTAVSAPHVRAPQSKYKYGPLWISGSVLDLRWLVCEPRTVSDASRFPSPVGCTHSGHAGRAEGLCRGPQRPCRRCFPS